MHDNARQGDKAHDGESRRQPEENAGNDARSSSQDEAEEPVCAICGHAVAQDDLVCPNCGTSLVAG
jgi:rubrerythrin